MTDYEKLLEEVDAWAASLRANGIAPTGWYPLLAAALREVMDERNTQADLAARLGAEKHTALADVEAMRAVVDAGREIAEYEDCGKQYCGFCDHPLPDCSGVCCPGSRLRAALRALDARATPPASHRCPGCNAEHRGEYDHCETCRARIATPSGGKGRTR